MFYKNHFCFLVPYATERTDWLIDHTDWTSVTIGIYWTCKASTMRGCTISFLHQVQAGAGYELVIIVSHHLGLSRPRPMFSAAYHLKLFQQLLNDKRANPQAIRTYFCQICCLSAILEIFAIRLLLGNLCFSCFSPLYHL